MPTKSSIASGLRRLGYKVVFVPHSLIGEHIACYNVVYKGRRYAPKAAAKLGIPLGQIWISDRWKRHAMKIAYHELQEIRYQNEGHSLKEAHERARKDEKKFEG